MIKAIAACLLMAITAGTLQARPFTAKDLALLDRVSDPRVSPDGRFVAYNLRSTDWEGNHGVNALWVIDRGSADAAPRLVRDQEKSSTSPRWSADGQWLYFISSRSGSAQVWRTSARGGESKPVTKLPLDVVVYRLTPDGHALVAAVNVHAECESLACSKAKDEAKAKEKSTGVVYDSATPRFWDTYLDGRYIGLFAVHLGNDNAPATDGTPLTRNYQADIVARPEGDDSSFVITQDGRTVIFSARPSGSAQGLGDPNSLYSAPLDGSRPPQRLDAAAILRTVRPPCRPTAEVLRILPAGDPRSRPRARRS
jgi:acylaminoacyl-peptidase